MTWLTGWNYRKAITVSNSGSSLTDYQVSITIDTASLVSAGKLLSNCDDIRFTSSDGSTLLNYWIESGINSSSTKIWVKIPSITNGNNIIYLYYNNPTATSLSNGTNTFDFFDDFSGDLSKWNLTGTCVIEGGALKIIPGSTVKSKTTFGPYNYRFKQIGKTNSGHVRILDIGTYNFMGADLSIYPNLTSFEALTSNATGSYQWTNGSTLTNSGTYQTFEIAWTSSSIVYYQNDITLAAHTTHIPNMAIPTGATSWYTGEISYISLSTVRKYASPEPTTCVGGEEVKTVSWLTNWNRRKLITITGSTNTQTDYQMKLTVHKSTGTDTSTDIYLGNNVNNDFSDLRFTSSDGSTLLNYWIESYTSGTSAIVWIKIPSIPISPCTTTTYLYYGNSGASTSSNGESTFVAFDDFSTNKLGTYWAGDTSYYTVNAGVLTGSGAVYKTIYHPINHGTSDFLLHVKTLAGGTHNISGIHDGSGNIRNTGNGVYYLDEGTIYGDCNWGKVVNGSETWISAWQPSNGNNTFEITKIGTTYTWYQNGVSKSTANIANFTQSYLQVETENNSVWNIIYVRNLSSPEPTFSLIGSEEISPPANITATSLTITPSNPCISGSCIVTVDVIWTNTGGTTGSFTPSIKIDNMPVAVYPPLTPVSVGPSLTASQQFVISGLITGIHNICPDPN